MPSAEIHLQGCEGLRSTFSKIGTKFDAHSLFLSLIHRENRHMHVHGSKRTCVKNANVYPATCNLAHWLTRRGSPTIHRCIALPQLLYRWRHRFGKFWIPSRISGNQLPFSMSKIISEIILRIQHTFLCNVSVKKVKQFLYRPGEALRIPGG